jgi:ribonuclease E
MAKKMLIDATHAEETRVVVVDGNKVEEFDFETVNKRQLAGNIYLAKVTRVEPSLQAAFVDYGGNRHGFLAFSEIHPDYYQIPVADRQALLAEERAFAEAQEAEENERPRRRSKGREKAEKQRGEDPVVVSEDIPGMALVDLDEPADDGAEPEPETIIAEAAPVERDEPYVAADHASDTDAEIESVAEEDVTEEIRQPRKPRPRRYKIQEVIKVRQIMLVQVVKEERGNKGAALTTYLSLAGRYCVLMPNTARGGGISRKITNAADRKKLKEIAGEIEVPEGAGLIIRTAGSQRTKAEIKRDYEYLMRLWEQIRDLTLNSIAPAPIYEEGDLIKRTIRDLYNKDIDEVLVEGEAGYRAAKDFMKMIMPSHAKNVKHYSEGLPLLARFQVESYLSGMFNPTVQLRSGGYIVIGVTEALVAIDVNSGRATKEGSIEETALKTNLEAAEEVARQLRLRDLAGLIVIDFIDMEERKNNAAVEKRLKEKLKTDRARIQVGRISGFGLLEMSRQRLRPGMLESTTAPCAHCHGTGIIRSDDSLALQVLRQLEEEGTRKRSREVLLKAPIAVVNFLINQKREHLAQIESRYGMSIRIEADPAMISPDFSVEKFKTATRFVPEGSPVVSVNAMQSTDEDEDDVVDDLVDEADEAPVAASVGDGEGEPSRKKKRRRRRRRRGGNGADGAQAGEAGASAAEAGGDASGEDPSPEGDTQQATPTEETAKSAKKSARSRSRRSKSAKDSEAVADTAQTEASANIGDPDQAEPKEKVPDVVVVDAPAATEGPKPKRTRASRSKKVAQPAAEEKGAETAAREAAPEKAAKPKVTRSRKTSAKPAADSESPAVSGPVSDKVSKEKPAPISAPEAVVATASGTENPQPPGDSVEDDMRPKRRGWWSLGR